MLCGWWEERVEQGGAFDVAGGAEAGGDGVEVAIVVAGMADELPGAAGHGVEDCAERGGVEMAGGGDAECAVGGEDAAAANLRQGEEARLQEAEAAQLEAAKDRALAEGDAPARFEWIADGGDAGASRLQRAVGERRG